MSKRDARTDPQLTASSDKLKNEVGVMEGCNLARVLKVTGRRDLSERSDSYLCRELRAFLQRAAGAKALRWEQPWRGVGCEEVARVC